LERFTGLQRLQDLFEAARWLESTGGACDDQVEVEGGGLRLQARSSVNSALFLKWAPKRF
jgi:hypothetical protein